MGWPDQTESRWPDVPNWGGRIEPNFARGKKKPEMDKLPIIAQVLGVSVDVLIGQKPAQAQSTAKRSTRLAKVQELFEGLKTLEQQFVLKQIKGLIAQH